MSKSLYLVKRGEVWHYHRRVPTSLLSVVGKQFFKKSLGVKDLKTTQRLRNALNVKVDAELHAAENSLAGTIKPEQTSSTVSLSALTEYLRQHVAGLDERKAARLVDDPPEDEAQRKEMKENIEIALGTLRKRDDPNGAIWVDETSETLINAHGASLDDKQIVSQFAEVVRRGLMELQHRSLDRLDDRYDRAFHDPLFDPKSAPSLTFGDLVKIYWSEVSEDFRHNDVSMKSADRVEAQLALLLDALGENTALSSIDDDTVQSLRTTLSRLPANRKKLYPNLSLSDAVAKGENEGKPILNPVTQAQYLRILSSVLDVGLRKGLIRNNPATGVKPIKKAKLRAHEKRLPWSDEQVVGFFTGQFYQRCRPDAADPYKQSNRGWRFWVPLLMLLTGARPNEICQMLARDLKKTPNGTWYLDLLETDDQDGQSSKNHSSRRRIPVHSELVRMGFVTFVEKRRLKHGNKHPQLFPEIKPDKYGNMASYPARRFREAFIPAEITLGDRQVFYSLRHNARDALRRAKAPPETLLAITGWSPGRKAVSDDYGDPGNPDLHKEWVEKIKYPGLDFSFLYTDLEQ